MRKWWIICFLCFSLLGKSQERCYVPFHQAQLAANDSLYFFHKENREAQLSLQSSAFPRNGALSIPVVFHLVGVSGSNFPSDDLILSQLEILNKDYSFQNENRDQIPFDVQNLAVDMGLRFCLATHDPEGNPTSGIKRTVTTFDCVGNIFETKVGNKSVLYYDNLGGSSVWDTDRYLNFWVADNCNTFLGFSSFPDQSMPEEDGIVIDPLYIGDQSLTAPNNPYNLGKTLSHEVGHYFNLYHIWGESGCDNDDLVADTPLQDNFHLGCPIYPSSSCDSPDFFFNYMDYSDDRCLSMFTKGQRDRVWNSIATFRPSLLRDLGCEELEPEQTLTVYPNPARDILYFHFSAQAEPIEFHIFDSAGRIIYGARFENNGARWIDVWGWPNGLYFFESEDRTYRGKFLVVN